jgi:ketosteroid isomerase-like protein
MSNDRNAHVLEEVLDAFNRHDLDTIMSFFAEDCVFDLPRGPAATAAFSSARTACAGAIYGPLRTMASSSAEPDIAQSKQR